MPWEKQFDVEKARHKAMTAFWTRGYEATSMQDLLEEMGIQRGSFYATFESKHELLLSALGEYDRQRRETFSELASAGGARRRISELFEAVAAEARSKSGRRGCFLVNSALELAPHDPAVAAIVNRAFSETEAFFRDALEQGKSSGELRDRGSSAATAAALLGMLLGLRVLARSGASPTVVDGIVAQAAAMIG